MLEKIVERFIEGKGEKLAVVCISQPKLKSLMAQACMILSEKGIFFQANHTENTIMGNNGNSLHFVTKNYQLLGREFTGIFIDNDLQNAEWPRATFPNGAELKFGGDTDALKGIEAGAEPNNTPFNAEDYAALERIVKGTPTDKEVGPSLPVNHERDMFVRVLREIEDKCCAKMVSQSVEDVLDLVDSEGRKAALRDGVENILAFRKLIDEVINERD